MSTVTSPCNGMCRLDSGSGLCLGCLRTAEEIGAWCQLPNERRRELLVTLEQRQLELARFD